MAKTKTEEENKKFVAKMDELYSQGKGPDGKPVRKVKAPKYIPPPEDAPAPQDFATRKKQTALRLGQIRVLK